MPLDLKRLRQDPSGFVASVRHSLQLRRQQDESILDDDDDNNNTGGNNGDGNYTGDDNSIPINNDDPRIEAVLRCHQESARTLQQLQQCRAKRNEQKKQRQVQAQANNTKAKNSNDNAVTISEDFKNKTCISTSEQPAAASALDDGCCPTKQDEEALEASHRNASEQLEKALLQLPNYVDEAIYKTYSIMSHDEDSIDVATVRAAAVLPKNSGGDDDSKRKSRPTTTTANILPQDSFYCLGGYEDLAGLPSTMENDNTSTGSTTQSAVLTNLGMQLLTALEKMLMETLCIKSHYVEYDDDTQEQSSATTFASWTLPDTMPLSIHNVDSIWGPSCTCDRSSTREREPPSTAGQQQKPNGSSKMMMMNAPSWMGLLRHCLAGKTYYDRELPMYNFLVLSSPTQDPTSAAKLDDYTLQDAREVHRRATWSASHPKLQNNGKKGKLKMSHLHYPWYSRIVAGTKRVEVCILTGPSLQADSRIVQEATMQRLCDFYNSLVVPSSSATSSLSDIVRIRAVPPSQLLPAESSRLVLEGRWPASSRQSEVDHPAPVCLAYLSNLQDYASCFHDAPSSSTNSTTQQQQHQQNHLTLRHGNSRFGERVHILTGTICSLTETLEWMIQHNAMASGSCDGVDLPARVAAAMRPCWSPRKGNTPTPTHLRLAYRRTVTTNKHGKRVVTHISSTSNIENKPHSSRSTTTSESSIMVDKDTTANGTTRGFRVLEEGQKLSREQIQMEKLSCPFGFLPFHHG